MTTKALTAAASRYVNRKVRGKGTVDQGWQTRAWELYHLVPEVRFAATYMANGMSGATLCAGRRADDGTIEPAPDNHRAAEIVQQIAGGPDGQSKLLSAFGKHLTVTGEGWIVIRPNADVLSPDAPEDGHDWRVLSTREVRQQQGKLAAEIDGEDVEIPAGDEETLDPDSPVALRVWEPDPERQIEADSPVRASIDLLEELLLLNGAVKAIARSRLTGRGILLVPKGVRFPTRPGQGDAEDDLIEVLMMIAETAIREPESAAATVPIVLEVPAESISDFKLLTLVREVEAYYAARASGRHLRGLRETRDMLVRLGCADPLSYELHVPLPVSKAGMLRALETGRGVSVLHKRTAYGVLNEVGGERIEDVKVLHRGPRFDRSTLSLSTMPDAFANGEVGRVIRAQFTRPSPYELRRR